MATRKFGPGGVPRLSAAQIEGEIERLSSETTHTEQWMSRRARRKLDELETRDRSLRQAFEVGYRMGSDTSFLAPMAGIGIALLFVGALILIRDVILPLF
jgi:hypothetical protein